MRLTWLNMLKTVKDIFRVWVDESGDIVALLSENGHDVFYKTTRASKADKDALFETDVKEIV